MFIPALKFPVFKSITAFALILGLCLALFVPRYEFSHRINGYMFSLGTQLLTQPETVDDIQLIQLPEQALVDFDRVKQLRLLLKTLDRANAAAIGVLFEPLPSLDFQPREKNQKKSSSKTVDPDWQLAEGGLSDLAKAFYKYKVTAGVSSLNQQSGFFSGDRVTVEEAYNHSYLQWLPRLMLPYQMEVFAQPEYKNFPYDRLPVFGYRQSFASQPLLWYESASGKLMPDLALKLYAQWQGKGRIGWRQGEAVQLGDEDIRTDYVGQVLEYYSTVTGHHANIEIMDFDQALSAPYRTFKNKLIIIGQAGDPQLQALGDRLSNLINKTTFHTAGWMYWLEKLLLLFVLAYLVLLLPRLQSNTAYLLSLILLFAGVVFQYGMLVTQGAWAPLLAVYLYLIFGHGLVRIKQLSENKLARLRLQAHDALWHLGSCQFKQGDHDEALSSLLKCKPTTDVLDLIYDIGLGYERRRQYEKALMVFSEIDIRHSGYKDIKKRLTSLTSVAGGQTEILSPGQAQKTLIMPDLGLQLPVLGRYEIERELGRGAMGIVYLGKDPKINRLVAIKTLDYSQFSENEIKTIKARFFREAEAAGRLNHPNIVTVYDVGEEEGLSFIAMDYVQGVSLGVHSKADKLLPIEEVYRIVAEVAETLDYAHEQNIVHRDIKPGNIMYNPNDGSVKITDFGIARITDSVRTRTGSFMGSPSYMAPEQMTGTNVDGHADIYALGVSFYQLLTGVLPFEADSLGNLAYKITREKHRPIREVRPELPSSATRIINKALQKKPEKRYATGKEMADAIRRGMP